MATANLAGRELGEPTIAPAAGTGPSGYLPLDDFGVTPVPIGDEEAINLTGLPAFQFAGETFTSLGVTSNGYSVAGGATGADIQCCPPQDLPDPAPPNGVLAPFWTDLDGTGAPGILAAELTDGTNSWIVVEWRVNIFGTTSLRVFQHWLGVNGAEDITFVYDPGNLPAAPPAGSGLTVGAENSAGTAGDDERGAGDGGVDTDPGQGVVGAVADREGGAARVIDDNGKKGDANKLWIVQTEAFLRCCLWTWISSRS